MLHAKQYRRYPKAYVLEIMPYFIKLVSYVYSTSTNTTYFHHFQFGSPKNGPTPPEGQEQIQRLDVETADRRHQVARHAHRRTPPAARRPRAHSLGDRMFRLHPEVLRRSTADAGNVRSEVRLHRVDGK